MNKDRLVAVVAILLCVSIAVGFVSVFVGFSDALEQKSLEIQDLEGTIGDKNDEISGLQVKVASDAAVISAQNETISQLQGQFDSSSRQIESLEAQVGEIRDELSVANSQISSLTSSVTSLQQEVEQLNGVIATLNKPSNVETLVFHVCEKGEGYIWGRLPNANYTYSQVLKLNNGTYEVLLLPEYKGNLNWTETFAWLKSNFSGIPISLSIFEGGPNEAPNLRLAVAEIWDAVSALDVRELRIGEIVSWHIEHGLPFPVDWVRGVLNFARLADLRVVWSEWKVGDHVFHQVNTYIDGFEDIVTVAFQTNSGDLEPAQGFELVSDLFPHWGGSIQSWYWDTRKQGNETAMPASLFVQHALEAGNMGAETLQFEPYWYLFENGEPNENLKTLMAALT